MKTPLIILVCLLCLSARLQAQEGNIVTLQTYVGITGTNEIQLEAHQSAELVSFIPTSGAAVNFRFAGDPTWREHNPWVGDSARPIWLPFSIRGPATIQLRERAGLNWITASYKITPQAFDPTQTAIVLPGTSGATVTLECSTNLTDWASATNGVYTDLPAAKFFRIKVDRIQQ